MKTWENRPIEEAHLFNPAFCGDLLRRCVKAFNLISESKFPYPLIFLVLPIVLHRYTREAISPNTREQLHIWLQNNQDVRVGFAERAKRLIPITNESLNFLLQLNFVSFDVDSSTLSIMKNPPPINKEQGDEEIRDCYQKTIIVGRWLARSGSTANIYTMWGVKP